MAYDYGNFAVAYHPLRRRQGIRGKSYGRISEEIGLLVPSWPGLTHGCPVEGNQLSATLHIQPKIPLAGLDPAIYVFLGFGDLGGQDVDARNKSGQGILVVAPCLAPLDPTLSQLLNRTAVGLTRPFTPWTTRSKGVDARTKSAQDNLRLIRSGKEPAILRNNFPAVVEEAESGKQAFKPAEVFE